MGAPPARAKISLRGHPISQAPPGDVASQFDDFAGQFVADRNRRVSFKFVKVDVEIGAAYVRGVKRNDGLIRVGLRLLYLLNLNVPDSTCRFSYR
jgi:hypothetical protein